MKKLLSLDVSSKTGWAVFEDGKPISFGTLFPDQEKDDFGTYPFNYVYYAHHVASRIIDEVVKPNGFPMLRIVIEETNASQQNYSQKILEYIHFSLVERLARMGAEVSYVRSGEWRKSTEAKQNADEKSLNSKISREKRKRNKDIDADPTLTVEQKKKLKRLPIKMDGKVVGRKTRKHVAIRVANEMFNLNLQPKDEDAADALLLGMGFLRGSPVCDGTTKGGKSIQKP